MEEMDLSIIVVAWNVKELIEECFMAIRNSKDKLNKQIILVDNGSKDGTTAFVKEKFPEVEVIESPTNLGFIRANNLAYGQVTGKYVLMLNSDAFVSPETLQSTVDFLCSSDDIGVVGARLIGRDGTLQASARFFPTPFKLFLQDMGWDDKFSFIKPLDDLNWDHQEPRECDWVVGCYLLAKKSLIDRLGFFLREDFFMYNDDNDLCFRIKKMGYRVFFYPADVIHLGGANMKKMNKAGSINSASSKLTQESQYIYFRKNYGFHKVISRYLYLLLFDIVCIFKRLLLGNKRYSVKENLKHMGVMTKILFITRIGALSIN